MPPVQPYQPGPDTPAPRGPDAARGPDPTPGPTDPPDTAPRAVYRRYRPGDADPNRDVPAAERQPHCPAEIGGYLCTRLAGHRAPQHLAGTGRVVAAAWTGHGDDLAVWDGGPDDLPEVPGPETGAPAEDPTGPARLDRLVNEGLDLVAALNACPSGSAGRLVLLASLELPRATVVALAGESAREVAARHLLTLGGSGDPDLYRFFGPAAAVAALLREVAGA